MTRYNLLRYKLAKVFVYFLVLLSFEWIFFMLFISIDSNIFVNMNELEFSQIYNGTNINNTRNTTDFLQSTDKLRTTTINYTYVKNCTQKTVKLSQTPLPVTGLVGFPGTGSTWLRHLVQQMTGIGTSSMYCDGKLRTAGFPFECEGVNKKGTLLIKTHEETYFKLFKKIVLLIRNPYDALLAYFSWARGGHTGNPSKSVLLEANRKMFNWSIWWYVDLANGTLTRFKGNVHLVQYERLKTHMPYELRKLATFLQVNVTDHDIACTVKLQEGNFHRKTKDIQRLELLRTLFDEEKLLQLKIASATIETLVKDELNLEVSVGGAVEQILLDKT